MYKIVKKRELNSTVTLMEVEAPHIAAKAQAGQFIIYRIDELGERIPLTIADYDKERGTITIIFQLIGASTIRLAELSEGDYIADVAGPLGSPTDIPRGVRRVCVVGGGVGCAIAYPQAKDLFGKGISVDMIAGFRSKDIVILEEEMRACSDHLYITTDDGSYGEKGFTTDKLRALIEAGNDYDLVIAIGPPIMMKFLCAVTKPFGIKTLVSLAPLMIDGTGMCGCCRCTVGGEMKFACVDGPDFDGHEVDFEELMLRNNYYRAEEQAATDHICKLTGGVRGA